MHLNTYSHHFSIDFDCSGVREIRFFSIPQHPLPSQHRLQAFDSFKYDGTFDIVLARVFLVVSLVLIPSNTRQTAVVPKLFKNSLRQLCSTIVFLLWCKSVKSEQRCHRAVVGWVMTVLIIPDHFSIHHISSLW